MSRSFTSEKLGVRLAFVEITHINGCQRGRHSPNPVCRLPPSHQPLGQKPDIYLSDTHSVSTLCQRSYAVLSTGDPEA